MIWKFCSRPKYSVNLTASTVTTSYLMNDIETLIHESPANDLLMLGVCGWVNCLLVANDIRPLISPLQIIWRYSEDYDVFERNGHFHAPLISIWSKHRTFGRFHVIYNGQFTTDLKGTNGVFCQESPHTMQQNDISASFPIWLLRVDRKTATWFDFRDIFWVDLKYLRGTVFSLHNLCYFF